MRSDCSISPAHIYSQPSTVSACFLFCHHFTPKLLAIAHSCCLSRHRASSLYTSSLAEVFGKFFLPILGSSLESFPELWGAQTCELSGGGGGEFRKPCSTVWCRTPHDKLTAEKVFWILVSVQHSWYKAQSSMLLHVAAMLLYGFVCPSSWKNSFFFFCWRKCIDVYLCNSSSQSKLDPMWFTGLQSKESLY